MYYEYIWRIILYTFFLKTHRIRQNSNRKKEIVKTRHSNIEIVQKYAR